MAHSRSILLTHTYFLRLDPKQYAQRQPYPPLGTLYAASVLRNAGHDVQCFDTMFVSSALDIDEPLQRLKPGYVVFYDDCFHYLTKMCLSNMREAAFVMIQRAKRAGCIVIVSTSDANDHIDRYLDQGADVIIRGEGEITLQETLAALQEQNHQVLPERLDLINGISFRRGNKTYHTPSRPVIKNLDELPAPARDLINMNLYEQMWRNTYGYFSLNAVTTRGCPFSCNWCAKPIYGNRYNVRSPQHVVEELLNVQNQFGNEHVWFCDDIFGLKPGWAATFAQECHSVGLSLRYKMQSRADLLLKEGVIEALAQSGCETVWIGAESGSQKILDAMDKGITTEQIYRVTQNLTQSGIKPAFFLQFGYPGETLTDIRSTLTMLDDLHPADIGVSISYPLPGTLFYQRVQQELQSKTNWTDSDDLALLFHHTYKPSFYKRLHRYVHKRFRTQQHKEKLRRVLYNPRSFSLTHLRAMVSIIYYLPALLFGNLWLLLMAQVSDKNQTLRKS